MAGASDIEWTENTWNPVTGCTPISDGCCNCYALRMAKRLKAMGVKRYQAGFKVTHHPDLLDTPLRWKKSRRIFVNSMSDLFHNEIPAEFIKEIFGVMHQASWHVFQVLTKRAENAAILAKNLPWPENVWMGVTVESNKYKHRIDHLRNIPAAVKFLSIEPLIDRIGPLDLTDIDWVIVGGESGPNARPMEAEWVREIRDCCLDQGVPFFFKQWGGTNKKKTGRSLDGRTWLEYPQKFMSRNQPLCNTSPFP